MVAGLRSEVIKKLIDNNNTYNCSLNFDLNKKFICFDMNPYERAEEFDEDLMHYEEVIQQMTVPIIIEILEEIIEEKTDESS